MAAGDAPKNASAVDGAPAPGARPRPQRPLRAVVRECVSIGVVVAVGALALEVFGIGCPVKFATGVSCPGCGMTRAWLSALQLDFGAAFAYHPLFWIVPPAVVLAVALPYVKGHAHVVLAAVLAVAVVALVGLWLLRMATPDDLTLFTSAAGPGDVASISAPGWYARLAG